jgi:hypothetical protein
MLSVLLIAFSLVSTSQTEHLGERGGPGGTHFPYRCADNGYLVGVNAYVGSWIDNIQAVCAKYDPASGRLYNEATEGPVFVAHNGQTSAHKTCGPNQLISAFNATETKSQPVLGRIHLSCINSDTETPAGTSAIVQGSGTLKGGSSGDACSAGKVAVGFDIRAGSYLDAFGLLCAPTKAPEAPKERAVSHGGNDTEFVNPTVNARDDNIYALDWCREWGANCGEPAAQYYCYQRKNLKYVIDFKAATSKPWRTALPKTSEICTGSNCAAFEMVRCSNTPKVILPIPNNLPKLPSPGGPKGGSSPGDDTGIDQSHWEKTPATGMNDVGVTQGGQIWLSGKNGTIWSSNDGQSFTEEAGVSGFGRIAGGNKRAEVWAVGRDNHTLWHLLPGSGWKEANATDVADVAVGRYCLAGASECTPLIWIAGVNGTIWYSDNDGRNFTQIKAEGFCRVATHSTDLWAVGCNGTVWQYTSSPAAAWDAGKWEQSEASKIADVAADENDSLWLTGQNGSVWERVNGQGFVEISPPAGFVSIAVGHGKVYAVRADGTLWRYKQ